jgi:uncharacterized tellurite resistance protein B-like protein
MKRLEMIKNLLVMAFADQRMTEEEVQFLTARCQRWGLSESEFASAIEYALAHAGEITIPQKKSQRLELLAELMGVMAADGQLVEAERVLFAHASAAMEISDDELNELITKLTHTGD